MARVSADIDSVPEGLEGLATFHADADRSAGDIIGCLSLSGFVVSAILARVGMGPVDGQVEEGDIGRTGNTPLAAGSDGGGAEAVGIEGVEGAEMGAAAFDGEVLPFGEGKCPFDSVTNRLGVVGKFGEEDAGIVGSAVENGLEVGRDVGAVIVGNGERDFERGGLGPAEKNAEQGEKSGKTLGHRGFLSRPSQRYDYFGDWSSFGKNERNMGPPR